MAETVLNQEEQKQQGPQVNNSQDKLAEDKQAKKDRFYRMNRIAGIVLSILMIAITAFVLKLQSDNNQILAQSTDMVLGSAVTQASNYRTYVQKYQDTKIQLEETTRKLEAVTQQLNDVTAQLETTRGMLAQTQTMLAQAQAENTKLREELQGLGLDDLQANSNQNINELQARIASLKAKNSEATTELNDLKMQLRAFQADFSTREEGRSLISLFQNKIKLVKSRMRYLAQQAYFAKVAAQKEKDRIAALNGNLGYLIFNGEIQKPSGSKKSFSIDVKMVQ